MTTILLPLLFAAAVSLRPGPQQEHAVKALHGTDSMKYFMKIVPHDSSADIPMPTLTPESFVPVDAQPVPIKQVDAWYPDSAKPAPAADVWVRAYVQKNGTVGAVKVLRSTEPRAVGPATAAAKQWRFTPAMQHGVPVAVWAAFRVHVHAKE